MIAHVSNEHLTCRSGSVASNLVFFEFVFCAYFTQAGPYEQMHLLSFIGQLKHTACQRIDALGEVSSGNRARNWGRPSGYSAPRLLQGGLESFVSDRSLC